MDAAAHLKFGCLLAFSCIASAQVSAETAFEDGAYEIEVRLELPHLEDMAHGKVVRRCLSVVAGTDSHGLAVLSDNNPLAACPLSNVRRAGDELTFDIACEGRNSASATARFVMIQRAFHGRIAMQMGGKNMTMTEVQTGRRTGACDAGEKSVL